jgi:polyribonucleotide nucleotidyltransferase
LIKEVVTIDVGGRPLEFEVGHTAKQAGGAATVKYGDTVVLVTACNSEEELEQDWFPLFVEYREKTSAAGKIPGGFFKREGRPTEKETLTARLIDRPARPLFDDYVRYEVQVYAQVFSADGENEPDVMAINGASLALMLFPIPWNGPVGAVRVGYIDGAFVVNPPISEMERSELDLVVAGTENAVIMVEGDAKEVEEETLLKALEAAVGEIRKIIGAQREMLRRVGSVKMEIEPADKYAALKSEASGLIRNSLPGIIDIQDKIQRNDARREVLDKVFAKLIPEGDAETRDKERAIINHFFELEKEEIRRMALDGKKRQDGRAFDEIREITVEVSVLPRTHGSALFTRGQTQALVTTTLGTVSDEQRIEGLAEETTKAFMLHYNFPPFSVGEVRPIRGPSRRDIGHGALAERSFKHLLPTEDEFPYTIRVVSDILESNGSSSMATVSGASLALMDAGVPTKASVAGVAMGLVFDGGTGKYAVLTDIQGMEDHYGDMDLKVAGTRKGITAFQMDLKVEGVSLDIMREALEQARRGRLKILDEMDAVLAEPRPELSPYAPRIITFLIPVEKIGTVIGPGGKTIRKIIAETGVDIDIEDDGRVTIASVDPEAGYRARERVEELAEEVEVGKVYTGVVTRLMKSGAFVEILPGQEGLIHISQLDHYHVNRVEDVLKIGDEVTVKVVEIDDLGRVNLSRKACIPRPEGKPEGRPESRDRGGDGKDRGKGRKYRK